MKETMEEFDKGEVERLTKRVAELEKELKHTEKLTGVALSFIAGDLTPKAKNIAEDTFKVGLQMATNTEVILHIASALSVAFDKDAEEDD